MKQFFHLEGNINKHNSSFWSQGSPHWVAEKIIQSPKIIVWVQILRTIAVKWTFCATGATPDIKGPKLQNGLKYKMLITEEHFDIKIIEIHRSQPKLLSFKMVTL